MTADFDEQVLEVVRRIPPGTVMSYGDVAEFLGAGGPRQVGSAMSRIDGAAWWRVVHANGSAPPHKEAECRARWRAEGTPLRADGIRVDMRRARWDGVGHAPKISRGR